jgi:hypothetical protein
MEECIFEIFYWNDIQSEKHLNLIKHDTQTFYYLTQAQQMLVS